MSPTEADAAFDPFGEEFDDTQEQDTLDPKIQKSSNNRQGRAKDLQDAQQDRGHGLSNSPDPRSYFIASSQDSSIRNPVVSNIRKPNVGGQRSLNQTSNGPFQGQG